MRAGPLYMVLAGLMFTLMTAAVRVTRQELGTLDVVWWRSAIGVAVAFAFTRGAGVGVVLVARGVFALRALFGLTAMYCYYTAAKGLAVTDLSILHKVQPILIAILAPLMLGAAERAGWIVWLLLAAGLIGCGVLLAPDLEVGSTYGMWALGGSVSSAFAHIYVRRLGSTDDPRIIVLWFMIAALVVATIALVAIEGTPFRMPPTDLLPYLVAVGVTAALGQLLMTLAYKRDRAVVVAAAAYSAPIWAVAIDVAAFDLIPGTNVIIGGSVIVAAGLVLLLRREPAPDAASYN